MNLKNRIENNYSQALKARKEVEVLTLRGLKSSIKNKEIEVKKELGDDDLAKIVSSEIKKRADAIEQYKIGNRPELAKKEQEEINILEQYLPEQLSEQEIEKIIAKVVENNLEYKGNFGKIMSEAMKEVQGRASGQIISQKVKEALEKE